MSQTKIIDGKEVAVETGEEKETEIKTYPAITTSPPREGDHGLYSWAEVMGGSWAHGHVTFSITLTEQGRKTLYRKDGLKSINEGPAWKEKSHPNKGELVILSDVIRKQAGWRARLARWWRVVATVNNIFPEGRYIETRLKNREWDKEFGSVTFSFRVWPDDQLPEQGTDVILYRLIKTDDGWRACAARHIRPEDSALLDSI